MRRGLAIVVALAALAACGGSAQPREPSAPALARWTAFAHVRGPVDIVGPRRDGAFVVAAHGRLWLLKSLGDIAAFAPKYAAPAGLEPYIALASGRPRCFHRDTVFALKLTPPHGVVAIDPRGRVRRFATIAAQGLEDGIAFGHTKLFVTITAKARTTVVAIDCRGAVSTVTRHAPRVEGGIAVAPKGFGRFGGDLIAPDELSGKIWAITPTGRSVLVAVSGLPHGQDIGVESETFVPRDPHARFVVADRSTPGNRHPGDDLVLELSLSLTPGDLLVATEGGAETAAISCTRSGCHATHVALGPARAHVEGHIAVIP